MDLSADKVAVVLGALATFIPAVLGAIKTYKASGDTQARLDAQDKVIADMQADQKRAFKEQGQAREEQKYMLKELRAALGEAKQKLASVPSRSEFNYRREPPLELTPLPSVAPRQDPITEKDLDPYPDIDDDFKPKRRKR